MINLIKRLFSRAQHLKILGLSGHPTQQQIKLAYYAVAKNSHPDSSGGSTNKFIKAQQAYEFLKSNPNESSSKPGNLNEQGFEQFEQGFQDISWMYEQYFKDSKNRQKKTGNGKQSKNNKGDIPKKGANVFVKLQLTLNQLKNGCTKTVSVNKKIICKSCPPPQTKNCHECRGKGHIVFKDRDFKMVLQCFKCNGSGRKKVVGNVCSICQGRKYMQSASKLKVTVPRGQCEGNSIQYTGEGNQGSNKNGNLYVYLQAHDNVQVNLNLRHKLSISIAQAVLGAQLSLITSLGKKQISVPQGTPHGSVLEFKGQGLTDRDSGEKGSLQVQISIIIPSKPSQQQRRFYQKQIK